VNASLPPGQWQTYEIVYTAPRFDRDGALLSKAYLTVIHNGVLIQNHVELTGSTEWLDRPPYKAHPVKLPITLQDHSNPVRFRNIWVRELGEPGKPEYLLPDALLDSYTGKYERSNGELAIVQRAQDGLLTLDMESAGRLVRLLLYAQDAGHFFAKTTDVQVRFEEVNGAPAALISVGGGEMYCPRIE